jgi:hypothetical protein
LTLKPSGAKTKLECVVCDPKKASVRRKAV